MTVNWAALERRALEAGVRIGVIRSAATHDELRLAIAKKEAKDYA
jgi:hypothetical protein